VNFQHTKVQRLNHDYFSQNVSVGEKANLRSDEYKNDNLTYFKWQWDAKPKFLAIPYLVHHGQLFRVQVIGIS
jgi:hypothetical protein